VAEGVGVSEESSVKVKVDFNVNVKRKYVVNGKEYASLEEMPPEIREAIEKAKHGVPGLDRLEKATNSPADVGEAMEGATGSSWRPELPGGPVEPGAPITPGSSSSLSLLWLIIGLVLLIALFGLYYLLRGGGS
jgi:hypothetical protein